MGGSGHESETIGERVRRLREERGLSQRELSEPGISYAYISRIEANARRPSLKAFRLLGRKLGVPPEYLETGQWLNPVVDRQIRVSDAELELRLDRDLAKAREVFQATLDDEDPEPALVARAHAGLGLLAARAGSNEEVIEHLEAAIEDGYLPPEARPDVWETLGTALFATGAHDQAVDIFERALEVLRRGAKDADDVGRTSMEIRCGAYLAHALSAQGLVERARAVLDEVSEAVEEASPEARVFVLWTRGRTAWTHFDAHAAIDYVQEAIGLLQAADDALQLAKAHVLCAQMHSLDARNDDRARRETERHLDEAEPLLLRRAEPSWHGVLYAERAKLAALNGDAEKTSQLATEAARLIGDDLRFSGLRSYVLGLGFAMSDDLDQAQPHFEAAIDELAGKKSWREATEVARVWGRFLRKHGREIEALDVLEQATVLNAHQVGTAHRWQTRERPTH